MRSIPQTMIWELWRHGRWNLIAAALGAIAMPAFFFAVLRQEGVVDFRDSSQITMHMALLLMNLAMFIAAGFGAQEPPSRFYALPVTTASLVAWRMFPVMTVTALLSAMSSAVLNAAFGVGWPILGPALFSAVLVAAVQSAIWSTDKSGWEVPVMALVTGCAGVWFKSCYGAITSQPSFFWTEVTTVEIATLAAFAALAYCVAVNGVSRARRGDTLPGLGMIPWLDRLLDPAPASGASFRSAAHAQSWFEWRQKGRLMPAITIFGIIAGCCIWLISSRDATTLYEGILAGGGLVSAAGLLGGLVLGNCGSSDADLSMGQFLATRPMTSTEMARTILKTGAKGLLLAWIIWLAALLTISLVLRAVEAAPRPLLPRGIEWWYFPASLVGAWTMMGLMAWVSLAGRSKLLLQLLAGLFITFIAISMLAKLALSRQAAQQFFVGLPVVVAALSTIGTVMAFVAARRRGLVGWPTIYVAVSFWATLSAVAHAADVMQASQRPAVLATMVGIAALAVAPLATAPLALAWNRMR